VPASGATAPFVVFSQGQSFHADVRTFRRQGHVGQIQLLGPLNEQQAGDLLYGGKGVGNAVGPDFTLELADLVFEYWIVLQHGYFFPIA